MPSSNDCKSTPSPAFSSNLGHHSPATPPTETSSNEPIAMLSNEPAAMASRNPVNENANSDSEKSSLSSDEQSNTTSVVLASFTCFSRLPPEIQVMIFEDHLRVSTIVGLGAFNTQTFKYQHAPHLTNQLRFVNKLARKACDKFTKSFYQPEQKSSPQIRLNPDIDTLWVTDAERTTWESLTQHTYDDMNGIPETDVYGTLAWNVKRMAIPAYMWYELNNQRPVVGDHHRFNSLDIVKFSLSELFIVVKAEKVGKGDQAEIVDASERAISSISVKKSNGRVSRHFSTRLVGNYKEREAQERDLLLKEAERYRDWYKNAAKMEAASGLDVFGDGDMFFDKQPVVAEDWQPPTIKFVEIVKMKS